MPPSPTSPDPENDPKLMPSKLDFPVIGIGASAGGLAAVQRLLEALPDETGVAIVVILHLSPKHESNADRILQRSTKMNVVQVAKPLPLEKNHVYVISPRKHLSMNDGYLRLTESERPRGRLVAIDYFFRTLAQVHREHAFAVVLSGTGADGSAGISRIRELGGVTLAQSPDDAEYDQMPREAIATGAVDIVLPLPELAQRIMELTRNARRIVIPAFDSGQLTHEPSDEDEALAAEDALREVISILRAHTGHDFRHYKRATVLRRIERRMQVNAIESLPAYRDFLQSTPTERPALLQDMLISVTNFFRDPEAFESIEQAVLPQLFLGRGNNESVRAWTAGCATGEEAYSIAMLLAEESARHRQGPAIQVFATDIDDAAITRARSALYSTAITPDVATARLSRFFVKEPGDHYRVQKNIREKVLFARHNVLQDPPFSKLDLVSCRNLLIYLNREVQRDVLEMFHFALKPGGYLFLGSSESADAAPRLFTSVDKKNRIYRASDVMRVGVRVGNTNHSNFDLRPSDTPTLPSAGKPLTPLADLHHQLMIQYAPPSILLGGDYSIVHMSEGALRFLRHVGGVPSFSLLTLILPGLRLALRTAVFQCQQGNASAASQPVPIVRDGERYLVAITAKIAPRPEGGDLVLVMFNESKERSDLTTDASQAHDPVVLQLEEELRHTREQLQITVEQSETSSEELKASNEELQSINEELRSATEELETSKEELQSMNEELVTVNHELKLKVEETGKVADDLQNLIASTDIATVFIDRSMCIKRYTPRAIDVFSIIPADVGRSLMDITHRLDYEDLLNDAMETFQSLRSIQREVRSNDGRWYIARMLPYRTTEDRIEGAILTFIDITERRNAEDAVRKHEERMRLVADNADYAIITFELDGTIASWNNAAIRIFGYDEKEAIGQNGDMLLNEADRAKGIFSQQLAIARSTGRAQDENWYLRKDGAAIFCSGTVMPLSQGGMHGFAKITRDATKDKQHERERENLLLAEKASRESAQQAVTMKDEFLATMSHELKHPLNLMLINAELLALTPQVKESEAARRATEVIRTSALSQGQIIDDLLDLSRINTGKLALKLSDFDLNERMHVLAESARDEAMTRGLDLQVELPGEAVEIRADPVRIDQIIWNLINNAIKFTPRGGSIRLALFIDMAQAVLTIRDTGRGIEAGQLEHIFEMFHQVDVSGREAGGLGIGLALVHQLVELHGGTVKADSDGNGKGSAFTVRLPLCSTQAAPQEHRHSSDLRGLRILVVDDSPEILAPFRAVLEIIGASVDAVDNAAEALERLKTETFDILLSDIGMPDMNGYELIREVRALGERGTLKAIAITGFGRTQDELKALQAGFDAHIRKPLAVKALLDVVARLKP